MAPRRTWIGLCVLAVVLSGVEAAYAAAPAPGTNASAPAVAKPAPKGPSRAGAKTPAEAPPRSAESASLRPAAAAPTARESTSSDAIGAETLYRLASVPNMLGDFYARSGEVLISDPKFQLETGAAGPLSVDLPSLGGGRVKLAENNKAWTMDRVFFNYNHFHNPLEIDPDTLTDGATRRFSVDRYTLGVEKTLASGLWSVELRAPLLRRYEDGFTDGLSIPGVGFHGGEVGNLTVSAKRRLWFTERFAAAAGVGVDTPTGSDFQGDIYDHVHFTVENESVHLLPYIAMLAKPSERVFWHAFFQLDVATNGNSIQYTSPLGSGTFGTLTEQDLLYVDLGWGYWLFRHDERVGGLVGLATLLELHYTTTLQDADQITASHNSVDLAFGNSGNRTDVLDLTVGLHLELRANSCVRVAGVFPLSRTDRPFDAEVQAQVERRF